MLLLKSPTRRVRWDRSAVRPRKRCFPPSSPSLRVPGFSHPNTRTHVRLLGPCFKTGRWKPFRQRPWPAGDRSDARSAIPPAISMLLTGGGCTRAGRPCSPGGVRGPRSLGRPRRAAPRAVSRPAEAGRTFPGPFCGAANRCWPARAKVHRSDRHRILLAGPAGGLSATERVAAGAADSARARTGAQRFPVDNFTRCLTLSPECFSTFPHGTCSLSVSRQYLALGGIYHPLWAAIPNNPTL